MLNLGSKVPFEIKDQTTLLVTIRLLFLPSIAPLLGVVGACVYFGLEIL
jgi:hypothetical protein